MSRKEQFTQLFPETPAFRWTQVEQAFFVPAIRSWDGATSLSKEMRARLTDVPWTTVSESKVLTNARRDTHKAMLTLTDGAQIETVLMRNARGDWTICVSSQVGCAMRCAFCATGRMGLRRSLDADEIVDQYRFWTQYLLDHAGTDTGNEGPGTRRPEREDGDRPDRARTTGRSEAAGPVSVSRISNIVFMGMGEPLANYENVKSAIRILLRRTDIGPTHVTVSTVGVLPRLDQMLTDANWPHVRVAISLHSAVPETRKQIVPTSYDAFLPKLATWARRYLDKFGNRRHHLTFEYVMLKDVNDSDAHAEALAAFVRSIGKVRCNLIPYNFTDGTFTRSDDGRIERFLRILERNEIIATRRRTMGDDIAAACGQLVVLKGKDETS